MSAGPGARRHVEGTDGTGWEVPVPDTSQPPPKCPLSQSFSYVTGQYSIKLDYAGLTELLDEAYDLASLQINRGNYREMIKQMTTYESVPLVERTPERRGSTDVA